MQNGAVKVHHIFISPGHNYYGRRGHGPGSHETRELTEAECVAGQGIRGDRFFNYRDDFGGQVTFFDQDVFLALRREPGFENAKPEETRRNIFLSGVDLGGLIGCEFELQGIRFHGTEEASPCEWMDRVLGDGARAWMEGRGGLRARVLTSGVLRRDA
jgi:MOSC domain-containing protein YiiM